MKYAVIFVGLLLLVSCASQREISSPLERSVQYNVSQPAIIDEKVVHPEDSKGEIVFSPEASVPVISHDGVVSLKGKDLRRLSQWYNQSEEKRSVEWGVCFYGYSVEEHQDYTQYAPSLMMEAKSKFASATGVVLSCEREAGDGLLIGDAHIHHNGNILPSFLDTTTWSYFHKAGTYAYKEFHCVFLDNMSVGCYNWKGFSLDIEVK